MPPVCHVTFLDLVIWCLRSSPFFTSHFWTEWRLVAHHNVKSSYWSYQLKIALIRWHHSIGLFMAGPAGGGTMVVNKFCHPENSFVISARPQYHAATKKSPHCPRSPSTLPIICYLLEPARVAKSFQSKTLSGKIAAAWDLAYKCLQQDVDC